MTNNVPSPEKGSEAFKLVALVIVGIVVILGVIGGGVLLYFRPDASATFIGQIIQLMGTLTVGVAAVFGLAKVNQTVNEVRRQTNGTLSAKEETIRRLQEEKEAWLAASTPEAVAAADDGRLI